MCFVTQCIQSIVPYTPIINRTLKIKEGALYILNSILFMLFVFLFSNCLHQLTKTNSLWCKSYFAINLILRNLQSDWWWAILKSCFHSDQRCFFFVISCFHMIPLSPGLLSSSQQRRCEGKASLLWTKEVEPKFASYYFLLFRVGWILLVLSDGRKWMAYKNQYCCVIIVFALQILLHLQMFLYFRYASFSKNKCLNKWCSPSNFKLLEYKTEHHQRLVSLTVCLCMWLYYYAV